MDESQCQQGNTGEYLESTNKTLFTHSSENTSKESTTKTFNCETCNKSYRRKYNLNRHVETKHKINEVLKLKVYNENLRLQKNVL